MDPKLTLALVSALGGVKKALVPLLLVGIIAYFVYRGYNKGQLGNVENMLSAVFRKILGYVGHARTPNMILPSGILPGKI
jgi:hypothetical protein